MWLCKSTALINFYNSSYKSKCLGGRSPGLVVIGGDSCSEGCGFEGMEIFHIVMFV